jgi:hypothetical protein
MGRSRRHSRVVPTAERPPETAAVPAAAPPSKEASSIAGALAWATLAILLAFSLATLAYPAARAFYHLEVNYNEGWNVYNTQAAMQHRLLYPTKYGWTTVNYPFLSFYLVGYAAHFIGDYLLAGRLLSLLAFLVSCLLVGLITRKLTGGWAPAVFASLFCLGLICARTPEYVAMDDPQMLAHPFFLLGLWLYLGAPPSTLRIAGITSLFALGGNIKQNLLPVPLTVLADLFLISRRKALQFIAFGAVLLAVSIGLNLLIGGPFFISHLLESRTFLLIKSRNLFLLFYTPLGLPLAVSAFWSIWQVHNRQARVISFYFFSSLLIGAAFGGGAGVNNNTFFDNCFAMSIIVGACLDSLWKAPLPVLGAGRPWRFLVPVLLYSTVAMMFLMETIKTPDAISGLPQLERQYQAEVAFLEARPGPAICESLLRCYDAGKPYILDPFNSTSLVRSGKLSSAEIVKQIDERKYAAIETRNPVTMPLNGSFPEDVLDAIARNYVEAVKAPDCHIYVPRP